MLALDETGQEKKGECTAGVKRQHMGCADGVANGINTVHASLVREDTGHALVGFRQWIPEEHVKDPVRSLHAGLPLDLRFRTKGELRTRADADDYAAAGLLADLLAGRGDLDEAMQILRALADAGRGNANRLAALLTQQGRRDEAERLRQFGLNPDGSIACE